MLKSIETLSLRSILPIAFSLICLIPLLIFFYCVVYFDLLEQNIIGFSFAAYLFFSLIGYNLLRRIVDRTIALSEVTSDLGKVPVEEGKEHNELKKITTTFTNLVARLEDTTSELGRRVLELNSLRELTELSTRTVDMKLVFESVLQKLMEITSSHIGRVFSVTKGGSTLTREVSRGISDIFDDITEIPSNSTISGRSLHENSPIICDDPSIEEGFDTVIDKAFEGGPFIAKAIMARGKPVGVINLSRGKNGKPYQESDLDFISTALGHLAFALDNAELIREMKEACDELKIMQDHMIEFARLSAVHETVVTLSDKINSPLTVIQGHIEMLKQTAVDSRINQSLDSMRESVRKCIEIMNQLKEIKEIKVTNYACEDIKMIDVDSYSSLMKQARNI